MADGSNLKAKIGMDTGDFEKGAKKVTKAAQSMGKDIGTSLSDVGRAIGVDAGLLGDLARRIESATTLFRGMASAGGNAASSLTKAMAGLGGAIAGLGLTAVIIQFKELNRQADSFGKSLQGVNMMAAGQAYRQTYREALDDMAGDGKGWADRINRFKNGFSQMWSDFTHMGASPEQMAQAERIANTAADLASEMVDLQNQQSDALVTQQKLQGDINAQLLIAKDRSQSKADRDAAQAKAVELTNQKYDEQIALQKAIADNLAKNNALTGATTPEQLRQQRQAEAQVLALEAQRTQELTSLTRLDNQITSAKASQASSAKETQQATELTLAAATALVEKERALKAIQDQNNAMKAAARFRMDGALPTISQTPKEVEVWNKEKKKWETKATDIWNAQAKTLEVPALIKPVVDTEAAQKAVVELSSVIEQGVVGMSEALGDLIGNLINGENAWQGFAQAGIGVVADMLSTVGKAFVTEGVGVIAAQMALKTGNGPAAIAAGAAMIALAATMKTAMSNAAANWSGGSGAAVASSSYSSGTSAPSTYGREMVVRVTGTLTGEGSKLKAVINNDDRRNNVTT